MHDQQLTKLHKKLKQFLRWIGAATKRGHHNGLKHLREGSLGDFLDRIKIRIQRRRTNSEPLREGTSRELLKPLFHDQRNSSVNHGFYRQFSRATSHRWCFPSVHSPTLQIG